MGELIMLLGLFALGLIMVDPILGMVATATLMMVGGNAAVGGRLK